MLFPAPNPKYYTNTLAQYSVFFDEAICATQFGITLPKEVGQASTKRQAEFIASRFCIRRVMSAFQPTGEEFLVTNGSDRVPTWPAGFVGSITHTDGYASAALALKSSVRSIGIDSERLLDVSTAAEIRDLVVSPTELTRFGNYWNEPELLSVIFSAKESTYKCLYPLVQKTFDFHDVEIISLSRSTGHFNAILRTYLNYEFSQGCEIAGQFDITNGLAHTAVVLLNHTTDKTN